MKNRNPLLVFLFGLITCGLYSWYWAVKTKGEMNKLGEKIPTAWIWLIPFIGGIWWYWKYSEGVEHVTKDQLSGVLAFIVLFLLGDIGQAIVQNSFNGVQAAPAAVTPVSVPVAPTAAPQPPVAPTLTPPTPPVVGG
jgi:hypothetical protein